MKKFIITTILFIMLFFLVYCIGDGAVIFYRDCMVLYKTGAYEDLVYKIVAGVFLMILITRKNSPRKCEKHEE